MIQLINEIIGRLQTKNARKGFTLVEVLIVIIIIGILAGGMTLVAGRSRDIAEASRIISDLRSVKEAALMWLTENPAGWTKTDWTTLKTDPTPLNKYLDKPLVAGQHRFKFETEDKVVVGTQTVEGSAEDVKATVWFLGYDLGDSTGTPPAYTKVRGGVKNNLAKQAESVGLYGKKDIDMTADNPGYFKDTDSVVYIVIQ